MKGRIKTLQSVTDTFQYLKGKGNWLIEDWEEGLISGKGDFKTAEVILEELVKKYNDSLRFKIFNKNFEINWDGNKGILLQENTGGDFDLSEKDCTLILEGDWRRFEGIRKLENYRFVRVKFYQKNGKTCYIRFIELLESE